MEKINFSYIFYEMTKSDNMTAADIRKRADLLRTYAQQYDALAVRMDQNHILEIQESGGRTLASNIVRNLDSNIQRLDGRIKKIESLNRLEKPLSEQILAAETKQQYVAETQPQKGSRKKKSSDK